MKVFYTDLFTIDLPPGHRFPMEKYRLVRLEALRRGVLSENELFEPPLANRETVLLAHTSEYYDSIENGTIDPKAMRKIGLPWSRPLVIRSLASVGGTVAASDEALLNRVSGCLAGGTHHAFADSGEGYCVFNDIAIAIMRLIKNGRVERAGIVDLDVHQGNGNSAILGGRRDVFILSMHGEKNYPLNIESQFTCYNS